MSNSYFKIEVQPTLNRAILFTAFPTGKPINFSLQFHKQTTAMQFQLDPSNDLLKNKTVTVSMFRNLEKSFFANKFLNLETMKIDDKDYRSRYNGVKEEYNSYLIEFFKERYDLHTSNDNTTQNNIIILGYKIHGLDEDFIFYFFQRKCRNMITRTDTIRTAGLQFSTQEASESLKNFELNNT